MKEWRCMKKREVACSGPFSYRDSFSQASYCQKVCSVSSPAFSTREKSNAANDNTESLSTARSACLILSEFYSEFYTVMTTI